jgi:pSer/pThr/pTyr-binding forkhead associated (FHA) protein
VSETTRTFGRQDFTKYIPESDYKYISRRHFTILKENDKFFIQDEGSSNGTKLNGVEIKGAGRKELKDNDKIVVADTVELQFNLKK